MAPFRAVAALLAGLWRPGDARLGVPAGQPVIELDMYRALTGTNVQVELANVDLGDLQGVLNYLHTEVVGENVECNTNYGHSPPQNRRDRCHSVDSVVRVRARVRNPTALIDEVGALYNWVDFGPAMNIQGGRALAGLDMILKYGDYVGAERREDARFPVLEPFYWFSLGGLCPNLPFAEKGQPTEPAATCVGSSAGQALGGHCPPGAAPSGARGCVYSYTGPGPADVARLDELVGITAEDCGGRPCKDFAHFRTSCSRREYKRRFSYSVRGRGIIRSPVCVEYDIHPACAKDCSSHLCKRVPEAQRELGLPFWRGRCDAVANARRAEAFAKHFGVADADVAHQLMAAEVRSSLQTCVVPDQSKMCHPSAEEGGMYCTREWGGVCQPCYIAGAVKPYRNAEKDPLCPWDLLTSADYSAASAAPRCASKRPRDLCCLYTSSCDKAVPADPLSAPLDDDGYALVVARQSTEDLLAFLRRVAAERLGVNASAAGDAGLEGLAYWGWGRAPRKGMSMAELEGRLLSYFGLPSSTSTAAARTSRVPTTSAAGPTASAEGRTPIAPPASRSGQPRGARWPPPLVCLALLLVLEACRG